MISKDFRCNHNMRLNAMTSEDNIGIKELRSLDMSEGQLRSNEFSFDKIGSDEIL